MRTLTVVRHAKAENESPSGNDFDRPLTKRGRKDAKQVAKLIARVDPATDLVIASPAARARETAQIIAEQLGLDHPPLWRDEVYNAKATILLNVLQSLPEDAQHIAVVGHNPGVIELVAGLASGSTHQLNLAMAPGALAVLQLELYWWNQIRWGCGQLQLLSSPKLLRAK